MPDDAQLIEKILTGDKGAFDQLTDKYYQECLQKARLLLKDPVLAQDIVQSAFMEAYFCLSNLQEKSLFRFWLLGIVKNQIKNYWRKTQRQYDSLEDYYQHLLTEGDNKSQERLTEVVLETIAALPDTYRQIITLFYYQDMDIKEIAQLYTLSQEVIKVRLHRGRKLLKQAFYQYPELYQYYQHLTQKQTMKKVRIADLILTGANKEHCSILLQDEDNTTVLPIVITTQEAMELVMALKNMPPQRPLLFHLTASILKENNLILDSIVIHDLVDAVFIASLKLRKGQQEQLLDARPSDAITFALLFDRPMYVSQKVLEQAGFPVPDKYRHTPPKEKGIAILVGIVESWQSKMMPDKTQIRAKTEPEVQRALEKLLAFTFGEEIAN